MLLKVNIYLCYYGLQMIPLNELDMRTLKFIVNELFMKLSNLSNFDFYLPCIVIEKQSKTF